MIFIMVLVRIRCWDRVLCDIAIWRILYITVFALCCRIDPSHGAVVHRFLSRPHDLHYPILSTTSFLHLCIPSNIICCNVSKQIDHTLLYNNWLVTHWVRGCTHFFDAIHFIFSDIGTRQSTPHISCLVVLFSGT